MFNVVIFADYKTLCCTSSTVETQTNEPDETMESLFGSDMGRMATSTPQNLSNNPSLCEFITYLFMENIHYILVDVANLLILYFA
jgi:hypothetical protein